MTAPRDCFAIVAPGFEATAADEMRALGLEGIVAGAGGVAFRADDAALVRANLHLRTVSRVLVRVATFTAKSFPELERRAKAVPWASYLPPGSRVALRVTCRKSRLYHSDAVAERLSRSIASAVPGAQTGRVGAADLDAASDAAFDTASATPAHLFVVRFERDECTISADSSGELLHRRGYRLATAKAPIRETIAAGVLLALGYDGTAPVIDPMCGSGTFAIEAALIARNIAPGIQRAFACESWPGFSAAAARRV
ncbi:MAG TPA: THUMP domain-containing protein, partial [Gemmatimonadaceae bacterium]|nr:THUMP domain-containing protein [Gemmatimonadaceae bacterium]